MRRHWHMIASSCCHGPRPSVDAIATNSKTIEPYTVRAVRSKNSAPIYIRPETVSERPSWQGAWPDMMRLLEAAVAAQPLIIKPYLGYSGTGVRLVRTARELAALPPPQGPVLIQEYVPGRGDDLKVYVAGDDVFAVRKPFSPTSFIVPGRPVPVTPAVRDLALRCGQVFGLGLYGVDIVEGVDGPWVVDVNTFPGYKGAPGAAARIADYIADYALGRRVLPEIAAPPALEAGRP